MIRTLLLFSVLLTIGCTNVTPTPPPPKKPPIYNRGDIVRVVNGSVVGIVTAAYEKPRKWESDPYAWQYYVMWEDQNLYHDEDQLELIEKFNWARTVPVTIKAEVTEPANIETTPKP